MPYVKAEEGTQAKSVLYIADDGSKFLRTGGSRTWRNNNPGNVESKSGFASRHGAIGSAGGFAVFPDYETGRSAMSALLHGQRYRRFSIADAIRAYAPRDRNDTERLLKLVHKFTALDTDRRLLDLSQREFENLMDAMAKVEGWREGIEQPVRRIIGARSDGNRLIAFLIEGGNGYLSKGQAIALAMQQLIDAVVVRPGGRDPYLRTSPDQYAGNTLSTIAERE